MPLSGKQRQYLRGLAHHRKPVVTVGDAGVTPAVIAEIEQALDDHELLKLKLRVGDRTARRTALADICDRTGAEAIQEIGQIAVVFRPLADSKIRLPV